MKKKKANLGSGTDYLPGWINVDIEPSYKADVIADLQQPFPFANNSLDEIKASDILEHFTKEDGVTFLRECYRVLKPGGQIMIRTHHVYQIIKQFADDPQVMIHFLYGNTETTGVFGAHKFAYTESYARQLLKKIGFTLLSATTEDTNFVFIAKKSKPPIQKRLRIGILHPFDPSLITFLTSKKHQVSQLSPFQVMTSEVDVLLVSGGLDKLLVTWLAQFSHTTIIWLENSHSPLLFHSPLISKVLYRLVKNLPTKIILPSKEAALEYMQQTRISLAKIVITEDYQDILAAIYDSLL